MTTYSENRGMARTYIPGLIRQGFSTGKALGFLKTLKLGYRKTDFLADWREKTGREKKQNLFKYIRKDYKPTSATISSTTDMLKGKYKYNFKITGRDYLTGEVSERDWSMSADKLLTRETAEQEVTEKYVKNHRRLPLKDAEITSVGCQTQISI